MRRRGLDVIGKRRVVLKRSVFEMYSAGAVGAEVEETVVFVVVGVVFFFGGGSMRLSLLVVLSLSSGVW